MTVEQWLGENNTLGIDIWHKKYQKYNENFDAWIDRVSNGHEYVRTLIQERKFLPGGRVMSNIGIDDDKSSMMNCYSRGFIQDDYGDIMQAATDIGKTFKSQGGQGLSLSKLRPKGSPIGDKYESDGIIPFMRIYNEVTAGTSQGGSRKGALLMSLDAWHKEAMNFITIKSSQHEIEKANLSLEIDDEFMQAVDYYYNTGEEVTIVRKENYSGHEVTWEVTPIKVFKAFIHNNYDWGDPGCLFVNRFRNYNLMEFVDDYQIETCNPCGEQPLPKNFACNLGSLNLSEFVGNPYTENAYFDVDAFKGAIYAAVEYLDNIVDLNADRHPLEEQRINSLNYRNIGLGVFGYATALMKLGLRYGSGDAISWTDSLFEGMFKTAVRASNALARIKGKFPKYDDRIWDSEIINEHFDADEINELKRYGLRNCSLLSVAPTGSLATMLGESGGCEPEFAMKYTRRTVGLTDNQDHYYTVYCKPAREYMETHGTTILPDYFVAATDIDPYDRIQTQSVMQDHIDTAISSTINLPESCTEEEMAQYYLAAWMSGLKGLTIFRANCKKLAILTAGNEPQGAEGKSEPVESVTSSQSLKRGDIVECSEGLTGLKRKLTTGCGSLHVLAYFEPVSGELQEVYLAKGSTGGCANFMTGLSRMISLLCRAGVSVYDIKDQLDSTGACPSYASRSATKHDTSKGSCCPMAIGNALIEMYEELQEELDDTWEATVQQAERKPTEDIPKTGAICPECGSEVRFEGGCNLCSNCGWSRCG